MWVLWVTVFLPMFINPIVFGWDWQMTPGAMTVIRYILSVILAASGACVAVGLWRNLRRSNNPSA